MTHEIDYLDAKQQSYTNRLNRNYLEKLYEMVIEWTRDEEAKYQASLLANELNEQTSSSDMEKDAASGQSVSRASGKSGKSASKKATSPSQDKMTDKSKKTEKGSY